MSLSVEQNRAARAWIRIQLHDQTTSVADLHAMIDTETAALVQRAISEERTQRHRGDSLAYENQQLSRKLEVLQKDLRSALDKH